MTKVLKSIAKAGSGRTSEPRLVGDIIKEMFRSNSRASLSLCKSSYDSAQVVNPLTTDSNGKK